MLLFVHKKKCLLFFLALSGKDAVVRLHDGLLTFSAGGKDFREFTDDDFVAAAGFGAVEAVVGGLQQGF